MVMGGAGGRHRLEKLHSPIGLYLKEEEGEEGEEEGGYEKGGMTK